MRMQETAAELVASLLFNANMYWATRRTTSYSYSAGPRLESRRELARGLSAQHFDAEVGEAEEDQQRYQAAGVRGPRGQEDEQAHRHDRVDDHRMLAQRGGEPAPDRRRGPRRAGQPGGGGDRRAVGDQVDPGVAQKVRPDRPGCGRGRLDVDVRGQRVDHPVPGQPPDDEEGDPD